MAEITVDGIYKSFGENQVLTNLSFSVTEGERVGIVGPNGCGKTTLLKIIAGEPADSGTVSLPRGCRCGVLEQLPDYPETVSVRQVLWQAFEHIEEMGRELAAMEERMSRGEDTDMARYGSLRTAFETAGGYETDMRYNMMTGGLGISAEMQERPFSSLSGGEKTRVSLARLMLSGTDLLLLDEPTNHLDLESIEWLEEYLRTFKGTVLTVSHDRYFLDKVTRRTLELYEGAAVSYPGNYTYYTERKQEEAERLEAAKKRQDKEIARLSFTVERMKGWGLGNKKVMKRAFAMQKRLERIERIKTIKQEHKMKNRFSTAGQSGEDVFMIEDLAVGYDKPLVEGFSASVLRGERIALLGPNGSGKTTLLTTVLRDMPPLAGKIYEGVGLKKGYLPQNVSFPNPERTLLDMMLYDAAGGARPAGGVRLPRRGGIQARKRAFRWGEGAAQAVHLHELAHKHAVFGRADQPSGYPLARVDRGCDRRFFRDDGVRLARPLFHQPLCHPHLGHTRWEDTGFCRHL